MKNLNKTLVLASVLSFIAGGIAFWVQDHANKRMVGCSYLDPLTIDILAFGVGAFFVIEGLIDILRHKNSLARQQINRCIRFAFGVSIITIHVLQVMHK